jgi:hypothetical protein
MTRDAPRGGGVVATAMPADMSNSAALIAPILLALAVYVWTAASLQAMFRKAGQPAWKAWVPFVNTVTLLQLGGFSGWWILLVLVPVVDIALVVILIVAYYRIGRSFDVGGGMTVLAALLFPVWSSILGWGPARWLGPFRRRGPVRAASPGVEAPPLDRRIAAAPAVPPAPVAGPTPAPAAPVSSGAPAHSPSNGAPAYPPAPTWRPPAVPTAAPGTASAAPAPIASVPRSAVASPAAPAGAQPAVASPPAAPGADPSAVAPPASDPVLQGEVPPGPLRRSTAAPDVEADAAPEPEADGIADAGFFDGRHRAPFTGTMPIIAETPVDAAPRSAFAPAPASAVGSDDAADEDDAEDAGPYPRRAASTEEAPVQAPVREVPVAAVPPQRDPWSPPATAAPVSGLPTRTPRLSPMPSAAEGFSETSDAVSAVAGAPTLGAPMSARASVSARRSAPELPDAESAFDETIVAARRRPEWMLTPPLGAAIPVTADVLIVGRRPAADADFPGAQLIAIPDETRTVSKTHARLELHDGAWTIVDLDSTNGVVLQPVDAPEVELAPSARAPLTERFLLGDAELRLTRDATAGA